VEEQIRVWCTVKFSGGGGGGGGGVYIAQQLKQVNILFRNPLHRSIGP